MMLLDKVNPNLAYRYDLSKGQIVEEWVKVTVKYQEAKDIKKLNSICAEKKYSQMTDDNCILGVSSNALLTMDGRVDDKNKIEFTQDKQEVNYVSAKKRQIYCSHFANEHRQVALDNVGIL